MLTIKIEKQSLFHEHTTDSAIKVFACIFLTIQELRRYGKEQQQML